MNAGLKSMIGALNSDLVKEYADDTELFAELIETQRESGLLYGDRATCPFLRPHFMARSLYDRIVFAAETIAEAEKRLTYAALDNEEMLARFDLTETEEKLVRIDPGYEKICVSARLDTFISGEDFKFLEYNAETPAGVGDQIPLELVLNRIPRIKEFLENTPTWSPKPHQKLLQSLFTSYREFGGKKSKPNIAIVDWEGVSTEAEFYILSDYFESRGFRTLIVDPSELEYNGTNLHASTFDIDILYKRVLIHEFLEKYDDSHPLLQAYRDGNLCIANSFRVKIPHKKMSFAMLSDEKYQHIFTAEQLDIIKKHIPWTRKLEEARTNFNGSEIDLIEFLRLNRERFLLKPNDDYGGKGIVLGWESTASEWEEAISEGLADSFVVQEKAAIEKEEFPVFDQTARLENLLVDFDPFLFQNQVEGGMVRLSSSSLVNVTQGGGQTALIVLEDH
ncbi:MAG: hypothetical protein R2681_01510 [Pyrinomonadaceae bacterium]